MVKASSPQEKLSVNARKGHGCQSDVRILSSFWLPACSRGQEGVPEIIVDGGEMSPVSMTDEGNYEI